MMKLVMSIVVLLSVGAAQDLMSPTIDIISELQKIKEKLNALHDEVRELRSKNEERVNVAFSATLSSSMGSKYFGPHTEATTLVYKNEFTNIGNAYDTNTGIFTAPVKGVYFFNFVVFNPDEEATGVKLLKNGNLVVAASDNPPRWDTEDTTCNSVTLLLEQGDRIHLQLIENRRIYTDSWRRNTFSGHLLFTV
ncbi:complement C1q tumor necrosis factor-related protein 3-like [Megalobrama amblycephala]|uniref:complement C1q tumor necrosis factor-related protein 3-like n=1 Tax=Megalobrama amblycephala TaxID=75352 RepID=UPI00201438F1|nr:complement C1q tumor necrosis factor-related protein 3-like [Megalobrama amblycephala]